MALTPGTLVSGYRVDRVLGAGGMGTVYLADNPVLPRQDALKVLDAGLSRDPSFSARFIREADLAASLDHPNIVTVYTRGQSDDGQLWIAMQYVPGSDVLAECNAGRMNPARAIRIVTEVAKALDYAHRRNLVHRDVKPANFLVSSDESAPGDDRVFLADFGIARALDEAVGLTAAGSILATVAYAAPEILAGGRVDGRADIYALGCSLYRMLTGRTPFESAGGMAAIMTAHLHAPPPRVTDLATHLPESINAVVATSLAKNPADRQQSAREFVEAAAAALQHNPGPLDITTAPPPPHSPAQAETVTYPRGVFSGPSGPPPPTTAPPRAPGPRRWIAALTATVVVVTAAVVGAVIWNGDQENTAPYAPQSFAHSRGTTQITTEPKRVAALGPGDGDAVLSLGVQPVVLVAPDGRLPSWEQQRADDSVQVLRGIDIAALDSADPDVIIATGDLDPATYTALATIAPTIGRPGRDPSWTWQEQLGWIGRVLGRSDTAEDLLSAAAAQQSEVRAQHPAFDSADVEVVTVADTGVTAELSDSRAAQYLGGLGFVYRDLLQRRPSDATGARPIPDPATLNNSPPAVRVVVRTDTGAGGGNYNGLPVAFTLYRGITVIVDDTDVVDALEVGGYAATEFLNTAFVDTLARQVH